MRRFKKAGFVLFFILPWILGYISGRQVGYSVMDAAYMAMRMYILEANMGQSDILFEIARWWAPLSAVSGIFLILKKALEKMKDFFVSFSSDAVALYGDADLKAIVQKNVRHAFNVDDNKVTDAKSHILLFATDEKGLGFYKENKHKLQGEVFIKVEKNESYALSLDRVKFFNPSEIIARNFWQEKDLRQVIREGKMKIAIVGSNVLSRKLLAYGLLNNLYSLSQKIEYHVWSENDFFRNTHGDFVTMNRDTVIYHDNTCADRLWQIASADRIIITDAPDNEFLAELANLTKGEIYCFDPMGTFVNTFDNKKLFTFGLYREILTAENIRTDNLYSFAKKLNYQYALLYAQDGAADSDEEKEWNKLNTFLKGSNIAAADYHPITRIIMEETGKTAVDYSLAELEHIRWCRYHFLNHWKYGVPQTGEKDAALKIHTCLVPFDELGEENKKKDMDNIEMLIALYAKKDE